MNTFDALMAQVNQKISEAGMAASQANASVALAREAADAAQTQTQAAQTAAQQASSAAQAVQEATDAWNALTVEAETAQAGEQAGAALSLENGAAKLALIIPRGADGADGPKGDPGRSGVTFRVEGAKLYITTD